MPRTQTELVNANFGRGFITETGPLGYPENSCKDMNNLVLERNGSVRVRNGLVIPNTIAGLVDRQESLGYSVAFWEDTGVPDVSFLVIYKDDRIMCQTTTGDFIGADTIPAEGFVSKGGLSQQLTEVFNTQTQPDTLKMVAARGRLYMSSPETGPFYLEYLPDGDEQVNRSFIRMVGIRLKFRDLEGLDDGFDITERPTVDTPKHRYNVLNMGYSKEDYYFWNKGRTASYYSDFEGGTFPSLADSYWNAYGVDPNDKSPNEDFFPALALRKKPKSPAAMGTFILDVLEPNRSKVSNIDELEQDERSIGPRAVNFFAGRVWYSGFEGSFNDTVLFSVVLPIRQDVDYTETHQTYIDKDAGKCYQKNDPTAQEANDLLDDDGGVIVIPGLGKVQGLVALRSSILVISDRGVWSVSGGIDPFSANNYTVNKVTTVGCVAPDSIVEVEGGLMYWGYGDIVYIGEEQGGASAVSLTDQTIKSFYTDISITVKEQAYGHYDIVDKKVYWTYDNNKLLIYDTVLQAFSKFSFDVDSRVPGQCEISERDAPSDRAYLNEISRNIDCRYNSNLGTSFPNTNVGAYNKHRGKYYYVADRRISGDSFVAIPPVLVEVDKDTRTTTRVYDLNLTVEGSFELQYVVYMDRHVAGLGSIAVNLDNGRIIKAQLASLSCTDLSNLYIPVWGSSTYTLDIYDKRTFELKQTVDLDVEARTHLAGSCCCVSDGVVDVFMIRNDNSTFQVIHKEVVNGTVSAETVVFEGETDGSLSSFMNVLYDQEARVYSVGVDGTALYIYDKSTGSSEASDRQHNDYRDVPDVVQEDFGGTRTVSRDKPWVREATTSFDYVNWYTGEPLNYRPVADGLLGGVTTLVYSDKFQYPYVTGLAGPTTPDQGAFINSIAHTVAGDEPVGQVYDVNPEPPEFPVAQIKGINLRQQPINVTETLVEAGIDQVTVGDDLVTVVESVKREDQTYSLFFVVRYNGRINVARFDDEQSGNYYDLTPIEVQQDQSVNYPVKAYLEVGANGFGDLMRYKQTFRVFNYFETKEYLAVPASYSLGNGVLNLGEGFEPLNQTKCLVQGRWEWSRHASSGKYSRKQKGYREPRLVYDEVPTFPAEYTLDSTSGESPLYQLAQATIAPTAEVSTSRLRVRGWGKTLNMYYENEPGYGFHLLGWAAPILINKVP